MRNRRDLFGSQTDRTIDLVVDLPDQRYTKNRQVALITHLRRTAHTASSAKKARTVHAVVEHGELYRPFD
jgi:hypothetical protein